MPTSIATASTPRRGTSSPHQRFTLSRLQREWDRLAADGRLSAQIDGWQLPGVAHGASLADVLVAAGMRGRESTAPVTHHHGAQSDDDGDRVPGDRVLAALVVAARTDPLAARVVLQRLLPGLSAIARRRARCVDEHLRNTDEVVAADWGVIRSHAVERQPHWVASALLRTTEYHAFIRPGRRRLVHELVEPSTMDVAVEPDELGSDPLSAIIDGLRLAGGSVIEREDARLIAALLHCDQLSEAARELDVSVRTVRNHRAAMIHRLRGALAA